MEKIFRKFRDVQMIINFVNTPGNQGKRRNCQLHIGYYTLKNNSSYIEFMYCVHLCYAVRIT